MCDPMPRTWQVSHCSIHTCEKVKQWFETYYGHIYIDLKSSAWFFQVEPWSLLIRLNEIANETAWPIVETKQYFPRIVPGIPCMRSQDCSFQHRCGDPLTDLMNQKLCGWSMGTCIFTKYPKRFLCHQSCKMTTVNSTHQPPPNSKNNLNI